MPAIGKLDRRVTIQRASWQQNEFGEDIASWSEVITLWAMRADIRDGERLAAGEVGSRFQARFTVRAYSTTRTVTPADRLRHESAVWDILGVKETAGGRNRFIEITAVRDADA
jgi:SPP1 family predicted phage head-tail adaptor